MQCGGMLHQQWMDEGQERGRWLVRYEAYAGGAWRSFKAPGLGLGVCFNFQGIAPGLTRDRRSAREPPSGAG